MNKIAAGQNQKITALRSCVYFSSLSEEALAGLCPNVSLLHFEPGEVICWQGEPCAGLYLIRTGSVKLFKLSPKGRELILRVIEEDTAFNEVPVFDGGPNVVNVAALEDCEIWRIDTFAFHRLMNENPELAQAVILALSSNLRKMVSMVEELSFHQVTNRLARLIVQLSAVQLEGQTNPRLTQDQMAARLGTVREVVARSLRELERSGAIRVQRRQIRVLNPDMLAAWAQEAPEN